MIHGRDSVERDPGRIGGSNSARLAWLAGQVLRERKLFGDIAAGAIASTIFAVAPPFIVMIVIDRVLVSHSYSTLNVLVGVILIMLVFETVLGYLRRVLTQVATTRIDGRLNLYIVEKLLKRARLD